MKQAVRVFSVLSIALLFCVTAGFTSDLPNCSSSGYRHNCFATVNFSGDTYKGEFQENKRHGFGTNTFKNGEKYIGEFKNGFRGGFGSYYFTNGEVYEGYWRNDQKNGLGVTLFADEYKGDKYIGYHHNNDMHGRGLYVWSDGRADVCFYNKNEASNCSGSNISDVFPFLKRIYTSLELQDRKNIQQILKDKSRYSDTTDGKWGRNTLIAIAEFAALEMSTIDFQKANVVENIFLGILQAGLVEEPEPAQNNDTAIFSSDLPACPTSGTFNNCFGSYTFANGDKYVGEFKTDAYNGQGTFIFGPNSEWAGDKHVGEYRNNKRNGQGTYTHANGDKYVGEYKNDAMNGQGTYTHADGDKYVGEFKNDAYNGQGTYTYADGTKEEGFWKDGEFLYASQSAPKEPENNSIANNIDPNEILHAASGTGFYVSDEGHIITNHHVINGCSEVKVHAEGKSTTATILAKDASNDLALLKISNNPPHVFAFSNENPYPLQDIIVAGFPFGDAVSSSLKFTTGVISSLAGIGNNYSQMQIDAAIQPGNSGGPIIDELGNIVGVAVSKLDVDRVYEDFGVIPENTNFGIKGSIAKILLQSFNVPLKAPNTNEIPKSELSQITTKGTLHLSCWMTVAQIEKMQSQKVLFEQFD